MAGEVGGPGSSAAAEGKSKHREGGVDPMDANTKDDHDDNNGAAPGDPPPPSLVDGGPEPISGAGITSYLTPKKECTTSRYRGVTKHRRSGRWESHIWVASRGKQIYLGGYELEEHAASAYDVARLKTKGRNARTNFSIDTYEDLFAYLDKVSLEDLVLAVRRQSQGFSKFSTLRGVKWVTRHPSGKWEAKALSGAGQKVINLGLYDDEETALAAYQAAMAKMNGVGASSNQMDHAMARRSALEPSPPPPPLPATALEQGRSQPAASSLTAVKAEVMDSGKAGGSADPGLNLPLQVQLLASAAAASKSLLDSAGRQADNGAGVGATGAKSGGTSPAVKTLSNTLASIWPQALEKAATPSASLNLQSLQAQLRPKQEGASSHAPSSAAAVETVSAKVSANPATNSMLQQFGQIGGTPTLQQVQLLNSLKNHPDLTNMAIHFQQKDKDK